MGEDIELGSLAGELDANPAKHVKGLDQVLEKRADR